MQRCTHSNIHMYIYIYIYVYATVCNSVHVMSSYLECDVLHSQERQAQAEA